MFSFISGMTGSWGELVQAIWVGFRFDLRLSVLITLPIIWAFLIPHWNLLTVPILQKLSQIYLAIAVVGTVFFYGFDLGNYSYLGHRMDVSTLRLLENPIIAMEMAWESYPIVWIVVVLFSFWGTFRQYQLLWSDAHFSKDPFIVAVALNPILYLNETRTFELEDFDLSEAQKYYSLMADELGVDEPNLDEMNYVRTVSANSKSDHPNIVIVFLESVGFNRMERTGNPMGATPNLDRLASEGISFDRFYIPMVGTARSVFGMLTGIHDVASVETASSNPRIVDQYSLVNALDGYDKYYIMGGSASWRNVRSLIQNNIPDMRITEQEDMEWGISDHDLFQAAHDQFEALDKSKPFFAVVQTATNHRPYSIPDDVAGFEILDKDETDLANAGFDSKEQYNAMRLLDHAVGEFMKNAASSTYGNNTIFLFFGDHGTSDPRANHMPPSDFELKLRSYQVPLIVYAPWKFKGGRIRNDVSQLVDLMPTVCGLAGVSYENRTLGRDLFHDAIPSEPLAMIVNKKVAEQHIAVVGQDHYLSMQKDGSDVKLHELWSNEPWVDVKAKYPEITRSYSKRLKGIYETAKYMLYHNKN